MGTATVLAQQVADRLDLPLAAVSVEIGIVWAVPRHRGPPGAPRFRAGRRGGSGQTVSIAGAVLAAAEKLLAELLRLAGNDSPLAGLRPGGIRLGQEGLASAEEPDRHESFRSILQRANREEVSVTASGTPPLEIRAARSLPSGARRSQRARMKSRTSRESACRSSSRIYIMWPAS